MIELHKDDITKADVDVIVNAATQKMLGGGGVDGAIHRAAGTKLLEACRKHKAVNGIRCPIGEARLTVAGDLQAQFVIHTVGPRYHIDENPQSLLASAYRSSLTLALEAKCQSIAFPAISCGAYRFPIEEASEIAIKVAKEFSDQIEIHFYLFNDELLNTWKAAVKA